MEKCYFSDLWNATNRRVLCFRFNRDVPEHYCLAWDRTEGNSKSNFHPGDLATGPQQGLDKEIKLHAGPAAQELQSNEQAMCSLLPFHRENINRIKKKVSCRVWSEAAHAESLMSSLLSDGDVYGFNPNDSRRLCRE